MQGYLIWKQKLIGQVLAQPISFEAKGAYGAKIRFLIGLMQIDPGRIFLSIVAPVGYF